MTDDDEVCEVDLLASKKASKAAAPSKASANMSQGQVSAPKEMQQSHEAEAPTKTSQPVAAELFREASQGQAAPKEMPQSHEAEAPKRVAEQTLLEAPCKVAKQQQQQQHGQEDHERFLVP